MRIDDLNMIYELEIESYEFPWTKEILETAFFIIMIHILFFW